MHRKQLLSLIAHYRTLYREEAETVQHFMSFVEAQRNCFDRNLAIGHITGSAWMVNQDRTKVLLTHHKKLNRWLQLGGHADNNSDIQSVALQEAYEESGLKHIIFVREDIFDLDIHLIPERGQEKSHFHYDVRFALQTKGSEKFKVSNESHELSWVSIKALSEIISDASIRRMQVKWLAEYSTT